MRRPRPPMPKPLAPHACRSPRPHYEGVGRRAQFHRAAAEARTEARNAPVLPSARRSPSRPPAGRSETLGPQNRISNATARGDPSWRTRARSAGGLYSISPREFRRRVGSLFEKRDPTVKTLLPGHRPRLYIGNATELIKKLVFHRPPPCWSPGKHAPGEVQVPPLGRQKYDERIRRPANPPAPRRSDRSGWCRNRAG